ncbi:MAG: type II toxin-antitoxin system Phd/YefM family antitoxin [Candidatus Peribacteraceae bacterium]
MNKCMTATEARKKFYDVIDAAEHPGVSVVITHEGIPKVVVMSFEEYEGWQETMEIMADPELSKDVLEGIKEMKSGKRPKDTISLDALKKQLKI